MGRACAGIQVLLGTLSALLGMVAIHYLFIFYVGLSDVFSIDVASKWHSPALIVPHPLLNNLLLLLIFYISHSVFARQWVKNLFSALFKMSASMYRQFYFVQSSLLLLLLCYGWAPQPTPLWDIQLTPVRYTLYGIGFLGCVLTASAFVTLPVLDFFGIQEPLQQLTGSSGQKSDLITSGVYCYVRHPMYTGLILYVWSHPTMTLSRVLVALTLTTYLLVSVPCFEEPDLVKTFGRKYKDYVKTTPMFFPIQFPSYSSSQKTQ